MAGEGCGGNSLNIKFRLPDGTELGPWPYQPSTTIATLMEDIVTRWPSGYVSGPETAEQVKLVYSGRILEETDTVAGSNLTPDEPGGVITVNFIVRPPGEADEVRPRRSVGGPSTQTGGPSTHTGAPPSTQTGGPPTRQSRRPTRQPRCSCSIL